MIKHVCDICHAPVNADATIPVVTDDFQYTTELCYRCMRNAIMGLLFNDEGNKMLFIKFWQDHKREL